MKTVKKQQNKQTKTIVITNKKKTKTKINSKSASLSENGKQTISKRN